MDSFETILYSGVSLKVKHEKATSLGITVNSEIEDLLAKLPGKYLKQDRSL